MSRTTPRKAKIEPIHIEEAAALKRLYETHNTPKRSQSAFAEEFGLGTQGNVWQYLNAKSPLNAQAAAKFAKGLGVFVRDFSPRLADEIEGLAQSSDTETDIEGDHAPVRMVDAKASAGKGKIVFSDDAEKSLMFRRDWLARNDAKPESTIAFEVEGDSMVDLHIIDGSVVLANQKKTDPISKKVYVLWLSGQLFVKQLVKQDGLWYARSHNKAEQDSYPDIQVEANDRIVGRAFWCGFGLDG